MTVTTARPLRVAMVAGETSGDLLAGMLLAALRQRWPNLVAYGIGGPKMAEQGFEAWWPHDKLAVRGYVEVLRHYRELSGIRRTLGDRLLADPPDLFIGVDAPDFNLALEGRMKAAGIPAVHFISPSIWAWRGGRIKTIKRCVDEVLCLFPIEPEIYHRAGVRASYVGHPLADAIPLEVPRAAARQALGLDDAQPVVTLMPGSRRSEVQYIGERTLSAALDLHQRRPDVTFLLPVVPGLENMVTPMLSVLPAGFPLRVLRGQSHEAMAACDVVLVASGTATLEAALFKRPMVITYAMNWLSWQIMKRMGYMPWVGLPNILLRDFVVPELLQDQATPQALSRAVEHWLTHPQEAQAVAERFQTLHQLLRQNTAQAATHAIEKLLGASAA